MRDLNIGTEAWGNLFFTVKDAKVLALTAYKIIQNDQHQAFVKCVKYRHNGDIRLIYMTEEHITLRDYLNKAEIEAVPMILMELLKKLELLSEYGFLDLNYLLVDMNRIYVDAKTNDIKFIYFPVISSEKTQIDLVTKKIKETLYTYLQSREREKEPSYLSYALLRIFAGQTLELHALMGELQELLGSGNTESKESIPRKRKKVYLENRGNGHKIKLGINEIILGRRLPESILGIKPPAEPGKIIISDKKTVEKQHCKIVLKKGNYYIIDLNSKSGTYLDKKRLPPMKPFRMEIGSRIRIADVEFCLKEMDD